MPGRRGMTSFKTRLIALYTLLVCANIAAGVWAFGLSTIVLIAAGLIAFTVGALARFQNFSQIGGVIATATSAAFLFAIATMNLLILRTVWQRFQAVRK